MECLLQYMDDIDDLVGTLGLVYERIRRLLLAFCALAGSLVLTGSAVWLAHAHRPLALAICLLLAVTLLYRAVTAPTNRSMQASS